MILHPIRALPIALQINQKGEHGWFYTGLSIFRIFIGIVHDPGFEWREDEKEV